MSDKSEKIFFRLNPIVAAQLRNRAAALGFTVSEFLRLAVFSALGISVSSDVVSLKAQSKGEDD